MTFGASFLGGTDRRLVVSEITSTRLPKGDSKRTKTGYKETDLRAFKTGLKEC